MAARITNSFPDVTSMLRFDESHYFLRRITVFLLEQNKVCVEREGR